MNPLRQPFHFAKYRRKITHVKTRRHANFAERAIRTFKDSLYKRVDNAKDDNVQWVE